MKFVAFPVRHSVRAPAVGYRISANGTELFYIPDVVRIDNSRRALRGIDLYIGDGAAIRRSLIRRRKQTLIGHASIQKQLAWCQRQKVRRAIFTHCGSEIVKGDVRTMGQAVRTMGARYGVEARIAHDGQRLHLDKREPFDDGRQTRRRQVRQRTGAIP
jgi:phosphoribosyl 1,2-cyclic phosphodiesterase